MYKPTDKMSDLIANNHRALLVISRFGIPLGFGDKTIDTVCKEYKIDTNTFLLIATIVINSKYTNQAEQKVSIEAVVSYLKQSHDYFLNFRLPSIREKLFAIVSREQNDLSKAIMFYFDEYVAEVKKHMGYEDEFVFPYIDSLIRNGKDNKYQISIFVRQHNHVEDRMTEFKNLIIKYYPAKSTNEINGVLFEIFSCEEDLKSHIAIEDNLLVPIIKQIESQRAK